MKVNVKLAMTMFFLAILLTLAGLLIFGQRGLVHLRTLQQQFAVLEADNQRLTLENAQLKKEIELLHENVAYIEDIARRQLGLVKKDELVYQLQPKENNETAGDGR